MSEGMWDYLIVEIVSNIKDLFDIISHIGDVLTSIFFKTS